MEIKKIKFGNQKSTTGKSSTPVAVKLKDGTVISLSDLPPTDTKRWVVRKKASVVRVFMAGLVSKEVLYERYNLTEEEFSSWLDKYILENKHVLNEKDIVKKFE